MRIAFAGTPEVAQFVLAQLEHSHHEIALVLTKPDAPKGRGRKLVPSAVSEYAEHKGIPVIKPASLKEKTGAVVKAALQEAKVDVVVVVAYGLLVPADLLYAVKFGWINLHFSILPRWRGAAPVQHAILAGDQQTGISIFQIEQGLDTGPLAIQKPYPIQTNDDANSLLSALAKQGATGLVQVLDQLEQDAITWTEQPDTGVTYATRLEKADGYINWQQSTQEILQKIRAFYPAPGAWTVQEEQKIVIEKARLASVTISPGRLLATKNALFIGTGNGSIELLQIKPAGKKSMPAANWARGVQNLEIKLWGQKDEQ